MNTTITDKQAASVITSKELLEHWKGHRGLTRRVIEAFPEKELFEYSVGGMRPFAAMAKELLAIAAPGIRQIVNGNEEELNENLDQATTKADILKLWDETTAEIDRYWPQIPVERFSENILAFGQYEGTVWSTIFYFIDNEIHHRAQGYVYLRSLGIEPPFFWER
ncbi:DinB family protein [Pontibacter beigongshangensis]|uniref:DinB family protein n=1 Tax=Pontibacter beigongshangensis TaxID=2574733 RepID=UPI00164FC847|nr:DinB family protein [Pontibacter beigongshangensis]